MWWNLYALGYTPKIPATSLLSVYLVSRVDNWQSANISVKIVYRSVGIGVIILSEPMKIKRVIAHITTAAKILVIKFKGRHVEISMAFLIKRDIIVADARVICVKYA